MSDLADGLRLITLRRSPERTHTVLEGRGEVGGKAQGLLAVRHVLAALDGIFTDIQINIPMMTILGTSVFDAFIERNDLKQIALSNAPDNRIAHAFQQADMPFEVLGELHQLAIQWTMPLAIRSSGLLEDTTRQPFAGVYLTKMILNNSNHDDTRFQKLLEAIKFVWASTYFKIAKDYCKATGLDIQDEKMAVIIQEMVGKRHQDRFYPELSGVARSYNYYPVRPATPQDGVVSLALGLGKTIVDGGKSWTYSPAYPQMPPPYHSPEEILDETQNEFWVVNLGEPPEYNPIKETEYMRLENLAVAERDGVLHHIASTYDPQSGRLSMGAGSPGPRALTFTPLLSLNNPPYNPLISQLLSTLEAAVNGPVEIEFAMTFDPHRFGLLQVRPMVVPGGDLKISLADLTAPTTIIASESVLGNGILENIEDIVYVMPDRFAMSVTRQIADELERHNQKLLAENRPYLLIVFGRLGTLDPWLGIPVAWGQVCGASVIVEATQENARVELSQGSHYFHNIINLGVKYFSMPFSSPYRINWDWLEQQQIIEQAAYTRRIRLSKAIHVRVDGRSGRGVIYCPR